MKLDFKNLTRKFDWKFDLKKWSEKTWKWSKNWILSIGIDSKWWGTVLTSVWRQKTDEKAFLDKILTWKFAWILTKKVKNGQKRDVFQALWGLKLGWTWTRLIGDGPGMCPDLCWRLWELKKSKIFTFEYLGLKSNFGLVRKLTEIVNYWSEKWPKLPGNCSGMDLEGPDLCLRQKRSKIVTFWVTLKPLNRQKRVRKRQKRAFSGNLNMKKASEMVQKWLRRSQNDSNTHPGYLI